MMIPVWHDDQQGSATAVLAGLIAALKLTGKTIRSVHVVIGMGAANLATFRLLKAYGLKTEQVIACDSQEILHRNRSDIESRCKELREESRARFLRERVRCRITSKQSILRPCGHPLSFRERLRGDLEKIQAELAYAT